MSQRFTDPFTIRNSLADRLIPVVDHLRNLRVSFGVRPYKVRILRTRWTGGFRGQGEEVVVSSREILPIPLVTGMGSLTETLQPVGLDEVGNVTVSEISPRYTEEYMEGLLPGESETVPDVSVFWEIELLHPGTANTDKRRFTRDGAPEYQSDKFQWTVKLVKTSPDRKHNGNISRDNEK